MTVIDKLVGSTEQTTGLSIAESAEDDEPPLNVLVEVAIAKGEWHNSEGQHEAALASFSDAINYLHHRVMPYQNLLTSEELDDYEDQFRRAWQGNAEAYQGLGEDRMAQIAAKTARDGWQDELNRWKRK
jgi:hypothetical protein